MMINIGHLLYLLDEVKLDLMHILKSYIKISLIIIRGQNEIQGTYRVTLFQIQNLESKM